MPWQERALRVIDLIPELDYVSRFYARMLGQLRIFPAVRTPDGGLEEITEGPPVDILARIKDSGGGISQILTSYGRLGFVTGEGNLFGYDLDTETETWTYVWNSELKVDRNGDGSIKKIIWTPSPDASGQREFTAEEAVVYKLWTPHPRRSGEATSPMRAIVEGDIAEELIALTKSVRSQATTRTTRGILLIPQEISPPPVEEGMDENPDVSPWIKLIAEHFELQVDQAGSPAASAPYLMEVPYEYIDRIRLVELHNPQHDYLEKDLRQEAVLRVARGVDFPAEALLGIGTTNHWAALQILMDMWHSHGAPKAREFCDDLHAAYYRPALREAAVENWQDILIGYDPSKVTVKPNRSDDARYALQLEAIGPSGYRKMLDIPEDYAPTAAERAQMQDTKKPQPSPPRDQTTNPQQPDQPGAQGDSARNTRASAGDRNMSVMDLALMRCRELAGIRLKQKAARSFPDQLPLIESVPLGDVAAVLGAETLHELGVMNTMALVTGGADNLRSLLRVWGHSKEQADIFGEAVEVAAARTLFDLEFPNVDLLAQQLGMAA